MNKKSFKADEKGSVVVVIVFVFTIIVTGALLSLLSFVVQAIDQLNLVSDVSYKFLVYFWVYGIPVVVLIGTISHFLSRLQKKHMETY